jgi:mono/diheme cytochrome c family protein
MHRNVGGALGAAALGFLLATSVSTVSTMPAAPRQQSDVQRGEYLVHQVAMCVQCHSPRDASGQLIPSELLQGASMPATAPSLPLAWGFSTPKLAGLPSGFTEESFVRFLQTGERTNGHTPKAPMPPFRMTEQDAQAIAAYLKTLK